MSRPRLRLHGVPPRRRVSRRGADVVAALPKSTIRPCVRSTGLGFDFDKEDYWSYTRGDPRECLRANPDALVVLRTCDRRLRKYVLTNCAEKQAREALAALGLNGEFDGVFGADAMGDVCKPERAAFEKVMASAGIDPKTTAFFEDSVKNLAAARRSWVATVLVGPTQPPRGCEPTGSRQTSPSTRSRRLKFAESYRVCGIARERRGARTPCSSVEE